MKSYDNQKSRWVRSLLTLILSYFRNMPVATIVLGREILEAAEESNLTLQKAKQKELDSIKDASTICWGIGICQILDDYAALSLNAQTLHKFPGSIVIHVQNLKEKYSLLKENFEGKTMFFSLLVLVYH